MNNAVFDERNMVPVESSNIRSVFYEHATERMFVKFAKWKVYVYSGVPHDVYDEFMKAPSKGSYLAMFIKGKYACELYIGQL